MQAQQIWCHQRDHAPKHRPVARVGGMQAPKQMSQEVVAAGSPPGRAPSPEMRIAQHAGRHRPRPRYGRALMPLRLPGIFCLPFRGGADGRQRRRGCSALRQLCEHTCTARTENEDVLINNTPQTMPHIAIMPRTPRTNADNAHVHERPPRSGFGAIFVVSSAPQHGRQREEPPRH